MKFNSIIHESQSYYELSSYIAKSLNSNFLKGLTYSEVVQALAAETMSEKKEKMIGPFFFSCPGQLNMVYSCAPMDCRSE